jgi:hypothetical protein
MECGRQRLQGSTRTGNGCLRRMQVTRSERDTPPFHRSLAAAGRAQDREGRYDGLRLEVSPSYRKLFDRDVETVLAREEWRIVPCKVAREGAAGARAQLNGVPRNLPRSRWLSCGCSPPRRRCHAHRSRPCGPVSRVPRLRASFLFLLAIVAFAFTVNDVPPVETVAK